MMLSGSLGNACLFGDDVPPEKGSLGRYMETTKSKVPNYRAVLPLATSEIPSWSPWNSDINPQ